METASREMVVVRPFEFDAATNTVYFPYGVGGRTYHYFLKMPFSLREIGDVPADRIAVLVQYIGILLGTNFLVAFDSRRIVLEGIPVNREYLNWLEATLTNICVDAFSLAGAPFHGIKISATSRDHTLSPIAASGSAAAMDEQAAAVAVGCGKETSVMIENLRPRIPLTGFNIFYKNERETDLELPLFDRYGEAVDLPCERFFLSTADSEKIVADGGAPGFDDHTACASTHLAIGALLALRRRIAHVFFGNERSTTFVNYTYNWFSVNHQWEKSYDYEVGFQHFFGKYVAHSVGVSSALRHLWEIEIAREFCDYRHYHPIFFSCNHATIHKKWCGKCPKCLQVFIFMNAFTERQRVVDIYGADLLNDPELEPCFRQLLGLDVQRPLECVAGVTENLVSTFLGRQRNGGAWLLDKFAPHIETGAAFVDHFDI